MHEKGGDRRRHRPAEAMFLAGVALIAAVSFARAAAPTAAELAGTWAGNMTHDGDTQPIAFSVAPDTGGTVAVRFTIPVMHLVDQPFGSIAAVTTSDSVKLGSFRFRWDESDRSLTCVLPRWLVPLYDIPATFRRVDRFEPPARAPLRVPVATPVWEYAAGAALWAGPVFDRGTVYAGAQDGRVVALDAATGAKRWEYSTGGAVRCRPMPCGRAVVVQADDGFLYSLDAASGRLRWKTRVVDGPIVRLPFSDPRSRYDRFGSDVIAHGDRLYLGTHDGKLLALAAADGRTLWEFKAGDAILAAPRLVRGTLYAGSYDHHVYAVDAATGALRWKRDLGGAVVSTPAIHGDRVIVGTRAYDLMALDAANGEVKWKNYVWMSWIESSPVVKDGVVYVGSSDAAAVLAVDAVTGRRRWTTDVFGWSWGQPAVDARRVYAGTSSQVGYLVGHAGGLLALDRATGKPVWRYAAAAPDTGAFGFPGSPALGAGRVYVSGLDGRVLAFKP